MIFTHRDRVALQEQLLTKEEAEYPAPLAFAIASALSAWALRAGDASLRIPRWPIRLLETGDRSALLGVLADHLRSMAMVGVGLRLGLTPPLGIRHDVLARRSIEETSTPRTCLLASTSARAPNDLA